MRRLILAIVCAACATGGVARAAGQDIDFRGDCASTAPHEITTRESDTLERTIRVLNGPGERLFWDFQRVPTSATGGTHCPAAGPGAAFDCNGLWIALPAGAPEKPSPIDAVARISGTSTAPGSFRFRLRVTSEASARSCERSYLLKIGAKNPDLEPPTVPQGLHAVNQATGSRKILVRWQASTDGAGGTVTYLLESCAGQDCEDFDELHRSSATGFMHRTHPSLPLDTEFRYRVCAVDAAGNRSEFSAVASAITFSTDHPP